MVYSGRVPTFHHVSSTTASRTIAEIQSSLHNIVKNNVKRSVFIWGPPGIGKSSIVHKVAKDNGLELTDLRISQLAPTDVRGLPFVEDGLARFAPPSFLPREGKGILFVDEFNMASPSMMGIAQQLILDRQVGDYTVPDGWFIFAAGNRAEDKAAVSQMPAPVANRFIHFTVEPTLDSWKSYAIVKGLSEQIISFLNFRPQLLFNFNKSAVAWASPRSWEAASELLGIGETIEGAVGDGAAAEFRSFQDIYSKLPDVEAILAGNREIKTPKEPAMMYALCGALMARAKTGEACYNAFQWLLKGTTQDYVFVFMQDLTTKVAADPKNPLMGDFVKLFGQDKEARKFIQHMQTLLGS
jgi:hypothetical protein